MSEKPLITVTHRKFARIPWHKGPFVRDLYGVLQTLEESCADLEVTNVRVAGYSTGYDHFGVVGTPKYFRNEENLRRHSRHTEEPDCCIHDQAGIEKVLRVADFAQDIVRARGERPPQVYSIDLIDPEDKGGSYISFEDRAGLVKGNIHYVEEQKHLRKLLGVLEICAGGITVMLSWALALAKGIEYIREHGTTPYLSYAIMSIGAALSVGMAIDGFRRAITSERKYFQTTITPTDNSRAAFEKATLMAEGLKAKYAHF